MKDKINQILERLTFEIERCDKIINPLNEQMISDFTRFFDFDKPEQLYKAIYKKEFIQCRLAFIIENKENMDKVKEYMEYNIQYITKDLLNGNYQSKSTSTFNNLGFLFRKEVDAELLKLLTELNVTL